MGAEDQSRPSLAKMSIDRASGSIGNGKYRVFASLGRGGMADVLLGVAPGPKGFNKLLVVKRLRPGLAEDPAIVSMFLDEARLAARLSHPNVVETYEIGEDRDGEYFIVMEYLEGRTLNLVLDGLKESTTALAPHVWAKVAADALAGLHHAHELRDYDGTPLNVVHRDVSPQNLMITFDGRVKLLDFGIAKAKVNVTETETGIVKGKITYMAPEQAMNPGGTLDRRVDIFAMGIVLWECLTMQRLITGDVTSAAKKLRDMEFMAPSRLNSLVPPELDMIVMRALERDPPKRFQTAEQMRSALEGYLRGADKYVTEDDIGRPIAKIFALQRDDVRAQIRVHMANLGSVRELANAEDKRGSGSGRRAIEWPKEKENLPTIDVTESSKSVRGLQSSSTPAPRRGGVSLWWVAGGVVVFAAGLSVLRRSVAHGTVPAPAASSAFVAPPPVKRAPLKLEVRASPPEAAVTLDDAPIANPFAGAFARDGLEHRVQATAPGYATEGRLVRFEGDDDVSVAIDLQRAAPPPPPVVRPTPPPPTNAPSRPAPTRPKLDKDPYQ